MHPPCEMMVDSFLPAMREGVARRLADEGLSQGKIARLLGVTQASVSLYLKSGGRSAELLRRLDIPEEEGSVYISLLAEDLKKNPVYAVSTLYSLWSDILSRGGMCGPHRARYPFLAQCEICMKFTGGVDKREAIESVSSAVRLIEGSSVFAHVMPEVSVNVAYADEDASSIEDVVAVPGRIAKVKGMPRSFMKPEYGASTFVAEMLLRVKARQKKLKAAINLRYDTGIEKALKRLGLRTVTIQEEGPGGSSRTLESVSRALKSHRGEFDAIVDAGGPGIEPGLYLFGGDPVEVSKLAIRIARAYATGIR